MSISTEHHGYQIGYVEPDNLWRCTALALEAPSLRQLRSLIDDLDLQSERTGTPAFLLDHSGFSITPVTVIRTFVDGDQAWVINRVDDPRQERREKVSLHRIVEDTPENRLLLLAWRDASRAAYEEGQRVAKLRDSIPRMDGRTPVEPPRGVGERNGRTEGG